MIAWQSGVGEEWVYLICIHFGIFYDALCKWFGDVAVRTPSLSSPTENDSFNYYFQNQPHEDGSKAEMKPAHTEKD